MSLKIISFCSYKSDIQNVLQIERTAQIGGNFQYVLAKIITYLLTIKIFKNSKVSSNPINSKVKAKILANILKCCISGDKTSFSKYFKSNIHTPISPKEKIIEFELKVKPKKNPRITPCFKLIFSLVRVIGIKS